MKNSFFQIAKVICAMSIAVIFSGCATHPGSNQTAETYESAQAHKAVVVEPGVIQKVKRVTIKGTTTGSIAGGGLGGIAGAYVSRNGNGYVKTLMTSIAALGGSLVGSVATSTEGYQLIIKKANGQTISITQASKETFRVGQKVLITGDGRVLSE